jgi:hypothetical protein
MTIRRNVPHQQAAAEPTAAPTLYPLKEAAARLNMSTAMLRKLTDLGAIGHVRWGTGEQRARIGYTEAQLADFIASRTVPPSASGLAPGRGARVGYARPTRPRGRRLSAPGAGPPDAASQLLKAAIAAGTVTEWKKP